MSVFFEYPTDVAAAGKGSILATAFSHSDHPILAVSTSNGDLTLFHEEGETITVEVHTTNNQLPDSPLPASFSRPSSSSSHLHWHPTQTILACGWADGCVTLWGEKERTLKEEPSTHRSPVSLVRWSPDGSRLLTGDEGGTLAVWAMDNRMRLTCICKYQKSGTISHLAFRHTPQPSTSPSPSPSSSTCPPFFFASSGGWLWYADDAHHCSEVASTSLPFLLLHHSTSKDYLAYVTSDATLHRSSFSPTSTPPTLTPTRSVKLSIKGDGQHLQLSIAGHHLLAAANHENCVRFWHLDTDDSYILLFDAKHCAAPKDVITCISFNPRKRVLCGGTAAGRIVFWRYVGHAQDEGVEPSEADWEGLPAMESSAAIQHIEWGPGEGLLGLNNAENVSIVLETVMQYQHVDGVSAVQLTADSMMVQRGEGGKPAKFNTNIRVKGLDLSEGYVMVWNGKRAEVRDIRADGGPALVSSFATRASTCAMHGETVFCAVSGRLEVCNVQGVVQSVLTFAEAEGHPVALHVAGHYLACATSTSTLKLWDVSRKDALKLIVPGHAVLEEERGLLIQSVRVNSVGSKVSLLTRCVDSSGIQVADTRVHVYDVEVDRVFSYQFGPASYPAIHAWDPVETRLLVVETKQVEGGKEGGSKGKLTSTTSSTAPLSSSSLLDGEGGDGGEQVNHLTADVTTFFVTSDRGLLIQDSFPIDPHNDTLMALCVPHFLFLTRPTDDSGTGDYHPQLRLKSMRDFIGLETVDADTRRDLLAFSFHLTTGNLDEAYRAVKKISSEHIWANIAQQCVKTKRLDVAEVCLSNMNNARGVRAVREAKREAEVEVAIAQVAIQLHLLDDAERLYKECGRHDLLVDFYTACGRWKEALATAAKADRIHLKATHFRYARHLEQAGDVMAAVAHYKEAAAHRTEVPRLLYEKGMVAELEQFIQANPDPALYKWWAQLCESNGQWDAATAAYQKAGEILAVVRVLCQRGDVQAARELCTSTRDLAACYHMARHLETEGDIEAAIAFYGHASRHGHAIRLGKEHGLDAVLLTAALQSTDPAAKLDAAAYFEDKRYLEKAVMLYEKGGNLNRALDLCFTGQLFDALRAIADNLTDTTDPVILSKCATFFLQHQHYEKAVGLFLTAHQHRHALELCQQHAIKVSEAMAEKMTPPKAKDGDEKGKREREALLSALAELCREQGSYQLACKKHTQAGDSVAAIKCLIRSGDVEKVVYYASMSKKPEVFLLAAHHLQSLDWRSDQQLMATIVSFYQKAKANAPLSAFYEHCAEVEVDEFRDYGRALTALKEAVKHLIKAKVADKERRVAELDERIRVVQLFVEAREAVNTEAAEMVRLCEELVGMKEVAGGVRHGDVYALLMEYQHSQGKEKEALDVIERMRRAKIPTGPFLDATIVAQVYTANGMKAPKEEEEKEEEVVGEINEEVG